MCVAGRSSIAGMYNVEICIVEKKVITMTFSGTRFAENVDTSVVPTGNFFKIRYAIKSGVK